jgi:hypothetical protein
LSPILPHGTTVAVPFRNDSAARNREGALP